MSFLEVTPHDNAYRVRSRSRQGWHTVTLSPEACSCEAWRFKQRPCAHVQAVREQLEAERIAGEVFGEASAAGDAELDRLLA